MFANYFKAFIRSDFGIALLITAVWKIAMLFIGFGMDVFQGGAVSFLDHTAFWDSGWYLTIIGDWYTNRPESAAFYPLFPLIVSSLQTLTLGLTEPILSAQIVNTICVWLALVAMIKIGREVIGEKSKYFPLIAFLTFPTAFFLHLFYGEALFVAIGFWAYYFALKRKWLWVGVLLAALTATRLPSLLFVALCGLEFMRAYNWNIKKIFNKNLLFFFLAPLGFIVYGFYLLYTTGNFLGMFEAYKLTTDWSYQVFNPNIFETIAKSVYQIPLALIGSRPFDVAFFVSHIMPLFALATIGITSLFAIIKKRGVYIPLGIAGILSIIMFTLNSNIVSVHRYALGCLVIFIVFALFASKDRLLFYAACAIGVVFQLYLYFQFVVRAFAG